MHGLVAFSFGMRGEKAGPCLSNVDLAREVERIVQEVGDGIAVVVQHEIGSLLNFTGRKPTKLHLVTHHRRPGVYLDSEEVMAQADVFFQELGDNPPGIPVVRNIFVVAQPFLHLTKCRRLAEQAGYVILSWSMSRIRFDRQSTQRWTRSWYQLLWYAIKQKLFGHRGR
ncbi:MAG: hypothetical protein PHI73_04245 [Patescibacteria group bacterium]|nr:hypothetical protein [Patescibacteria group bacterium]